MNFELITTGPVVILELKTPVTDVREATDLIGACMEHDTDRLLIEGALLPADFFALQTRFAGEFLQKLQTYRLRTAVVVSPTHDYGERFGEYLVEAKRAQFSRLFNYRDEALAWLAQE